MTKATDFTVAELEGLAPTLGLEDLRALLADELAQGDGKTRKGAVSALEAAIDKHPEQKAALENAPPAVNLEAATTAEPAGTVSGAQMEGSDEPADGGPDAQAQGADLVVERCALPDAAQVARLLEASQAVQGDIRAGTGIIRESTPAGDGVSADVIAAFRDAPPHVRSALDLMWPDVAVSGRGVVQVMADGAMHHVPVEAFTGAEVPFAELLKLADGEGLSLVFADAFGPHEELVPIELAPGSLKRFLGERLQLDQVIELSGLGLRQPLSLELALLYGPRAASDAPAPLLRVCSISSSLMLEPGRRVAFGRGHIVF